MTTTTTLTTAPNPFADLDAMRLSQAFAEMAGAKRLLTTVPVGKPGKQDFVMVHPDPEYRITAAIIELKEDREIYFITPKMTAALSGEFQPAVLYTCMNRQGVLRIWPVKLPGPDGKINPWHNSAAEAAELATKKWVRVTANMALGAYDIFEAIGELSPPDWPSLSFSEVLKIAFKDHLVDGPNHPLIQRLRGVV